MHPTLLWQESCNWSWEKANQSPVLSELVQDLSTFSAVKKCSCHQSHWVGVLHMLHVSPSTAPSLSTECFIRVAELSEAAELFFHLSFPYPLREPQSVLSHSTWDQSDADMVWQALLLRHLLCLKPCRLHFLLKHRMISNFTPTEWFIWLQSRLKAYEDTLPASPQRKEGNKGVNIVISSASRS